MMLTFNDVLNLLKDKKFTEAQKNLDELIKKDQGNLDYHQLKGTIHFNLEELNEAIKSFSSAIKINNNNFYLYYLRGAAYTNQNMFFDAIKDFNKAILLNKNFSEAYYGLGILHLKKNENILAIDNFLKSINLKKEFNPPKIQLIKILTRSDKINKNESILIATHNKIKNININYDLENYIDNNEIKNIILNLNHLLDHNFNNFIFKETQIYRRNEYDLNCKRHKKVFNTYNIIPKFCFGCYKIQIEPDNLIDLIKLYIFFDNIKFNNNNTRKCMIETRPEVDGKYKGLIYCSSLEEANKIYEKINKNLIIFFNKEVKTKIKRGCTEYANKYNTYNSLENNSLNYSNSWQKYENLIDNKFSHLNIINKNIPTIKGLTLNDALIIKNWLSFAKKNNDSSIKSLQI